MRAGSSPQALPPVWDQSHQLPALLSLFLPVLSLPPLLIACPGPHGQNHLESDRKRQKQHMCHPERGKLGKCDLGLDFDFEGNNLERGLCWGGGGRGPVLDRKEEKRWSLIWWKKQEHARAGGHRLVVTDPAPTHLFHPISLYGSDVRGDFRACCAPQHMVRDCY